MINWLKKFCRSNKLIFIFSRIVYIPVKTIILYPAKRKYLKEAIDILQNYSKTTPNILFFGVPVHKNLGDLAQMYCSFKYFKKFWPDYNILVFKTYPTYNKKFQKAVREKISNEDIFFFQSGYCTTDEHLDHTMHKIMVSLFSANRIIFLPQTVLFKKEKEMQETSRIFNKHNRLLFLARDIVSFETSKLMFPSRPVLCYPDIVTTLIGSRKSESNRNGILLCMRNDFEQFYKKEDIQVLMGKLTEFTDVVNLTDTISDEPYDFLINYTKTVIDRKLDEISKYAVVITDRYHGTIFSLIANVPVIVLSSTDHKVKTGIEWFKPIYDEMCYSAKSLEEAIAIAENLVKNINIKTNAPYFEEIYYANLRQHVKNL